MGHLKTMWTRFLTFFTILKQYITLPQTNTYFFGTMNVMKPWNVTNTKTDPLVRTDRYKGWNIDVEITLCIWLLFQIHEQGSAPLGFSYVHPSWEKDTNLLVSSKFWLWNAFNAVSIISWVRFVGFLAKTHAYSTFQKPRKFSQVYMDT